jgi:hypothetical protein
MPTTAETELPWERDERRRKVLRTILLALVGVAAGPLLGYCVLVGGKGTP